MGGRKHFVFAMPPPAGTSSSPALRALHTAMVGLLKHNPVQRMTISQAIQVLQTGFQSTPSGPSAHKVGPRCGPTTTPDKTPVFFKGRASKGISLVSRRLTGSPFAPYNPSFRECIVQTTHLPFMNEGEHTPSIDYVKRCRYIECLRQLTVDEPGLFALVGLRMLP
jgi:hypothetical protein